MEDRFQVLKDNYIELKNTDISHDELGSANGYHSAQETKTAICDYAIELLNRVENYGDRANSGVLEDGYNHLNNSSNTLTNVIGQIEHTVTNGVHNNNFPNQRTSQIQNFENQEKAILKNTLQLEMALRVVELEESVGSNDFLKNLESKLNAELIKAKKAATDAAAITNSLTGKASAEGVAQAKGTFSSLSTAHKDREHYWFIAFIASAIAFIGAISYALFSTPDVDTTQKIIYEIFRKLLLISSAGLAIRVALGKYNLERNLRIIYDHRSTTLMQFDIFEKAISNDPEAKNQLRLEVARYVFSDPETGYRSSAAQSELNINPVLSTIEKASKKNA